MGAKKFRKFNKRKQLPQDKFNTTNKWSSQHSSKPSYGAFNGRNKNLASELNRQGLSIRSITPDGNCLFRSCADQLFGNQDRHAEVRRKAVEYIRRHKSDYLPFMDEESGNFNQVFSNFSRQA
ncbi:uncharacterized protein [Blastocystis hominis]|uniref:OTU domain-containing protein n=1 Tax=Blastocystis hominis TaxID=12968 RepID=D8LW10_BLAHO|nr:uncharacterized protein [Blastocystis hominis]CBK19999.2 unnamed protein product [Blastocystis hominis]|eukprot:XP_012894047.1 uncharacterized protein [Blastocystis hominis]